MPNKPAIRQPHQEMAEAARVVEFAPRQPKGPAGYQQQQQWSARSEEERKIQEQQQMAQQPQI